jgi:hypothetical protein
MLFAGSSQAQLALYLWHLRIPHLAKTGRDMGHALVCYSST